MRITLRHLGPNTTFICNRQTQTDLGRRRATERSRARAKATFCGARLAVWHEVHPSVPGLALKNQQGPPR